MTARALPALVAILGLGLAGCTSTTVPRPDPTQAVESAPPAPSAEPGPESIPTPSITSAPEGESSPSVRPSPSATPPLAVPVAVPVAVEEPAPASEITRTDAYELCKETALTFSSVPGDPRDVYAGIEGSDVGAVDGWWRVWIPGVTHPDGEPVNVALTCVLNGFTDEPTFHSYGGVASDYYPDRAAYFDGLLEPYSD